VSESRAAIRGESRSSALWGTSTRGGEQRKSALWGKGSRGSAAALVAIFALAAPLAATASSNGGNKGKDDTFVSPGLLANAKNNPDKNVKLIIQSNYGVESAKNAFKGLGTVKKDLKALNLIGAVAVEVPANKVEKLAQIPGLTVTADAPVKLSGNIKYSKQLWPYESGNAVMWRDSQVASSSPTIALVDSGVDPTRPDLTGRLLPQVTLTDLPGNSPGDGRGHGTFVAGIAAGGAAGYAGANPDAKILPIDVMDDNGMAMTSDVIKACEWILQNKAAYNIRVANFSLHSSARNHFYVDPLDRAVEKLWFNGVVVVAAAGNYGTAAGPSGVMYAPGNDPFVITVGAADLGGTIRPSDDFAAPWSAWGFTEDGFRKPELGAPGRYMIASVPPGSTLATQRPGNVVAPGYMQLSGTSFSAPVVAGTAAQLLARRPDLSPDQVKGVLMLTAKPVPNAVPYSLGVGELNAARAANARMLPNANRALDNFVVADPVSGGLSFDSASWTDAVKASASWAAASWADASWADASWAAASWADASWSQASWADASWADASWADASWADTSTEDAAEGDQNGSPDGAPLTPAEQTNLLADPDLAPSLDVLPNVVESPVPALAPPPAI
jgi:serine protease AprX